MCGHLSYQKSCWCMIFSLLILFTGCTPDKEERKDSDFSEEDIQALSETMGHFFVENLHAQHLKLDINRLIQGIEDAEAGGKPPLTRQEFFKMMNKYKGSLMKVKGAENLKIADDYLAEQKSDDEIISIANGKVQYLILERGDGPPVKEDGTPLMKYEGRLIDGTVFDSTEQRGRPLMLPLKSTIPGFRMGVAGMKEGEKRRIFIHPELGYGTRGRLPPNSLLIFDIEIVEAENPKTIPPLQSNPNQQKNSNDAEQESLDDHDTSFNWLKKIRETVF